MVVDDEVARAERVLARARLVAGTAANAVFFRDASPSAYEAYVRALETEAEAQEIVEDLRRLLMSSD